MIKNEIEISYKSVTPLISKIFIPFTGYKTIEINRIDVMTISYDSTPDSCYFVAWTNGSNFGLQVPYNVFYDFLGHCAENTYNAIYS